MARRDNDDYFRKLRQQQEDDANRRLNLSLRAAEKLSEPSDDIQAVHAWDEKTIKSEIEDTDYNVDLEDKVEDVKLEFLTAPTQVPERPRARTIAYNPNTKTVYIVFRTNHWHQYNDVSSEVWSGLKNSQSTNDYLPRLESQCSSHGAAQITSLSAGTLAQITYNAEKASRMQNGLNI